MRILYLKKIYLGKKKDFLNTKIIEVTISQKLRIVKIKIINAKNVCNSNQP